MRIHLTHALGEQTFELAPRSVDDPIVIGRSSEADLQVPSIDISVRHAVLFVHQDRWVLQNDVSSSGTRINGRPVHGPVVLKTGDVITFGTGLQTARMDIVSIDSYPVSVAPAIPVESDIGSLQTVSPTTRFSNHRRNRRSSTPSVLIPVVGAILIGAGCVGLLWAYLAYTRKLSAQDEQLRQNQKSSQAPALVRSVENPRQTIFMSGHEPTSISRDPQPTPSEPLSVRSPQSNPPGSVPDSRTEPNTDGSDSPVPGTTPEPVNSPATSDDPSWQRLLEARDALPPAQALYHYLQYRQLYNPDESKRQRLDTFQNEAIDLLWWQRVNDLVHQQNQIQTQIEELKQEKSKLPRDATPERRQQFDKQVRHLESLFNSNQLILRNEMKFDGNRPVDWSDEAHLNELRNQRDVDAYRRWTQRVINRVQSTRGTSAW